MNKEEILYNEIYERTKDFGRTHFIKEIMRLQRELEQLKEIEKEHQRINGCLHLENKELKEKYMKLEDKYIHNVFCCNEEDCDLFSEHQELKKQLEVGEEQYNDLVEEKEKLQEQLSINTLQLEEMKLSKRDYTQENILTMKLTLKENQQKQFIEYLENEIKRINPKNLDIGELNLRLDDIKFTQYLTYKEVLQKYKEIIGGKE